MVILTSATVICQLSFEIEQIQQGERISDDPLAFVLRCILAPSYLRTLAFHTPMQLVVPSVVRIAVMMLARICKTVFQPSFFIAFSF